MDAGFVTENFMSFAVHEKNLLIKVPVVFGIIEIQNPDLHDRLHKGVIRPNRKVGEFGSKVIDTAVYMFPKKL